jgi:deoxyribonuclease-1-like protein
MRKIFLSLLVLTSFASYSDEPLTVISWNVKHLGRSNFAPEDASKLLPTADLVALQEVNTSPSGLNALRTLARALVFLSGEDYCMALSEIPEGEKERFGFLWKNSKIAFVTSKGEAIEDCSTSGVFTIRLGVKHAQAIAREPAVGSFLHKATRERFTLVSVHLRPSGDRPQDELPPLLDTLEEVTGRMLLLGDFNLDARHPAFAIAREKNLKPMLVGDKTSLKMKKRELNKAYDNIWYRGFSLLAKRVINLFESFPLLAPMDIYKKLSDHCPIEGQFSPSE